MLGIKEDCVKVVDDKGCYDSVIFVGDSIFAVEITDDKGTLVMADDLSFRFDIREYLPDFYKGEKPDFKIRYNIEISGAIRIGHMTYILKSDSGRFIVIDFCIMSFYFQDTSIRGVYLVASHCMGVYKMLFIRIMLSSI